MRHGARAQEISRRRIFCHCITRLTTRLIQRVLRINAQTQLLGLEPVFTCAIGQAKQLNCQGFIALGVTAFGIDLQQLDPHGKAFWRTAQGFFEDFLCLQIATISQVNVGFGHRIHVTDGVELAQRVAHGRRASRRITGVDTLTTTCTKEGVRLQTAFQEGSLTGVGASTRAQEHGGTGQQGQACPARSQPHRVER